MRHLWGKKQVIALQEDSKELEKRLEVIISGCCAVLNGNAEICKQRLRNNQEG